MRRDVRTDAAPFTFPGASVIPIVSIIAIVWILSHAKWNEWKPNVWVFGVGSALYFVQMLLQRTKPIRS
jgi:hypothetical protein